MRILLIKTSALGDIIQTFPVLEFLNKYFKNLKIHFAVLEENQEIVRSHPFVDQTIAIPRSFFAFPFLGLKKLFSLMQRNGGYEAVFDLQGNVRSALITAFAKSPHKVGLDRKSVAEWPNIFVTNHQYAINLNQNIRLQYLSIISRYFQMPDKLLHSFDFFSKMLLKLNAQEKFKKDEIAKKISKIKRKDQRLFFIAPFSKWKSKELDHSLLLGFLQKIKQKYDPLFLFLQSSSLEFSKSLTLASYFSPNHGQLVLEKLSLPVLQHLMKESDLLIGMDSCPLHLALLAGLPTVSFFGPTSASVYGAQGQNLEKKHLCFTGICSKKPPLKFKKRCPDLRSCSLDCIDNNCSLSLNQSINQRFSAFSKFYQNLIK